MVRGAFRTWGAFGGDPLAFWSLTPWQTSTWLAGAVDGLKARAREGLSLAWHTAALTGAASVGKLPPLKDLLDEKPQKMTGEEIAAKLRAMATVVVDG